MRPHVEPAGSQAAGRRVRFELRRLSAGDGVGELKRMYVDRAARGNGIARALLSAVVDEAVAADLELLRLETGRWMVEAHALSESFGFVDRDDYDGREFGEIAAVTHLARLMELRLRRG